MEIKELIEEVKKDASAVEEAAFMLWLKEYLAWKLDELKRYDKTYAKKKAEIRELDIDTLRNAFDTDTRLTIGYMDRMTTRTKQDYIETAKRNLGLDIVAKNDV